MRPFVLAAVLVLALGAAPAAHAQDEVVAQVGLGAVVTRADFDHWMAIAATSRKRDAVPAQGTRAWRSLRNQVMELLLQNRWLEGEAALAGVTVTEAAVDRRFREQRKLSFPSERAYRAFLRDSGFTEADIRFRIRLEELSNRLRERVVSRARAGREDEALDRYVRDFHRRWRAVTSCAPDYAMKDCGRTTS